MEKRKIITYSVVALASTLALYFMFRSNKMGNELQRAENDNSSLKRQLVGFQQLLGIDSTLVEGSYNTALNQYNELLQKSEGEDSIGTGLRIELARELIQLRIRARAQDTAQLAQNDSTDLVNNVTAEEIKQYDAVSFELEKAKVQLARMKRQLQERSFGEYLTFKSKKGNQMHYVGRVQNNQANGFGVALLDTGSRYEGEWKDNQRHGEGAFYWPDGEYYVGSYVNDRRNGQGTYFWPNGEKYIGQWKDDKRNGEGVFYGSDGEEVTRGIWKNDKLTKEDK